MRLSLSNSCITLSMSEYSHNYKDVTSTLSNFSKTFWINNTLISLFHKKEIWERKKFLMNLYKLCSSSANKHNGHFLKKLMDSYEKPIKLVIKSSSTPVKKVCVSIKVINQALHVEFKEDEKFMFWYFVNQFKKYEINQNFSKKTIIISNRSEELKKDLFELLSKDNILGNHMQYIFSENELNMLFHKRSNYSFANNSSHNTPSIDYYFKVLNVKEDDSFSVIRKQYIRLAKRFHPDHQRELNSYEAKLNTAKFHKIQEAYEAIKDIKNTKIAA